MKLSCYIPGAIGANVANLESVAVCAKAGKGVFVG